MNWYNRKYNYKEVFYDNVTASVMPYGTLVSRGGSIAAQAIPGFSTRAASFDQYKIYKWKVVVEPPRAGISAIDISEQADSLAGLGQTKHYIAVDYTDSTPPTYTTLNTMVNSQAAKGAYWNKPLKIIMVPKFSQPAYQSLTTLGYMPRTGWIDVNDVGVPHYGFKWILDNTFLNPNDHVDGLVFRFKHTVYYGLKNINKPGNT